MRKGLMILAALLMTLCTYIPKVDGQSTSIMPVAETPTPPPPSLRIADNRITVENLQEESVMEIFSIVGVMMHRQKVKSGTNTYTVDLPRGFYIVRIGQLVKKIAIK